MFRHLHNRIGPVPMILCILLVLFAAWMERSDGAKAASKRINVVSRTAAGTREIPSYSGYYALLVGFGNYQ